MKFGRVVLLGSLGLACGALVAGGEPSNHESSAGESLRRGPKPMTAAESGVGRLVPDVTLTDVKGRSRKLSDLRDYRAIVVAFTCKSCPLSRKFAPTLSRLEKSYEKQQVAFVYVNPSPRETDAEVDESIRVHSLTGPYIRDRDGSIARALGATHSTDVIVLDARRTLIYRGAVDDQYGFGYALNAPRREYLVEALDAVLRGERPAAPATFAPGCPIDLGESSGKPVASVTFHNRISRILQQHCVVCHRDGGSAPFALDNYNDVMTNAAAIDSAINRGVMPPWFAAPSSHEEKSRFSNDPSLSPADKADLLAWIAGGTPEGDAADAPLPRQFPVNWQIGKPDLVVQIPKPVAVKATGTMPYYEVIVPTGFTEDKWIRSIEIQPTAPSVVHHVLVYVEAAVRPGDKTRTDDVHVDETVDNLRRGYFAAYVSGNSSIQLPEDSAKLLPAGSRLRFQFHYAPNGIATSDQTRLAMVFAKQRPQHVIQVKGVINPNILIPPGAENHPETGFLRVSKDMRLMAFLPHMHLRGKAFRYEAVLPDGKTQVLLDIPRYDTNWQLSYRLAEPIDLPRGSVIRATGWFDNSAGNPANPDPTRAVSWGLQAEDEMLVGFIEFSAPARSAEGSSKPSRPSRRGTGR